MAKKSGLKINEKDCCAKQLSSGCAGIASQQNVIDELKATNAALLEQFVRWQYMLTSSA